MPQTKENSFPLTDKPISDGKNQDRLFTKQRIVDKVHDFLSCNNISPLILAITGEWGSGKTSAMNLLKNDLIEESQSNVVLEFEPLLEGKLEVIEIIELFYLKLSAAMTKQIGEKAKPILKKLLSSLGTLAFTGTNLSCNLANTIHANFDIGEKYEKLIDIWQKNDASSYQKETQNLNQFLQEKKLKIFVFIDEIDRLPPAHIINFLMFARILETFENLVCIVGIDYNQVIRSLKFSLAQGVNSYDSARSYLDKLFHAQFHIHHNHSVLANFVLEGLEAIDQNSFSNLTNTNEHEKQRQVELIIDYLKTPRQIKKWLVQITINKELIDYYPSERLQLLTLMAVYIKHPLIIENLAAHTLPMLNQGLFLSVYVKEKYGNESLSTNDAKDAREKRDTIIIRSVGIKKSIDDSTLLSIPAEEIVDPTAYGFIKNVVLETKVSLLRLFIEGCQSKEQIDVYYSYFDGNTDKAIKWFIDHYDNDYSFTIISDLADSLRKQQGSPNQAADLNLLNQLWEKTVNREDNSGPYQRVILSVLHKHPVETVIEKNSLSLLESYIHELLSVFSIHNKLGKYFIENFKTKSQRHFEYPTLKEIKYNGSFIEDFTTTTIKEILEQWVKRVEADLNANATAFIESHSLSVWSRYVQWADTIDAGNKRKVIATHINEYLSDKAVSDTNKLELTNFIFKSCAQQDIPGSLFGNNSNLINTLTNIADVHQDHVKYFEEFQKRTGKYIP